MGEMLSPNLNQFGLSKANEERAYVVTTLALYFLGLPRIEQDGQLIRPDTSKATALLAYLAVTGQAQKRQDLIHLLWTGHDPARARSALRRTLSTLKKTVGDGWLTTQAETVGLSSAPGLWTDETVFQEKLRQQQAHGHPANDVCITCAPFLVEATRLYRGDFLTGFHPKGCPAFDEWRLLETERLRRQQLEALSKLVAYYTLQNDFSLAITYGRQSLLLDPLQEAIHRQLMNLYVWTDQPAKAIAQYETCRNVISQELGLAPAPETVALYEQLKIGLCPPVPSPPSVALASGPANRQMPQLPAFYTPLIGREVELAELSDRLQKEACHLLTITGPGGVGKTRLAVQLAWQHAADFPDGVFFVPLAGISSPASFIPTVATALNFTFYGREDPQTQLFNYLRDKMMLLIIDNFEHLIETGASLLELLKRAPRLKLVVTSRISLNFWAEWLYEVRGLSTPPAERPQNPQTYSAIQLFLHHVYRIRSNWQANSEDVQAATHICRSLAGLPLGIELAAATARHFSCADIATRITATLDTLKTAMPDIPPRHRSLRAVFEDSWLLLTTEERAVTRRLSVFPGSFASGAALAVSGATPSLLSALADRSFLRQEQAGRYLMHPLLRQYAAEKLAERPSDSVAAHMNHGRYFVTFLQNKEPLLSGSEQQLTLQAINHEIENVRQSWHWFVAAGNTGEIERALAGLYEYYEMTGQFQEGLFLLNQALSTLPPQGHQALRGRLLNRQGVFFMRLGQYDQAELVHKEGLRLLEEVKNARETAFGLNQLGVIYFRLAQFHEAQKSYAQSLALYQEIDDQAGAANVLCNIGNLYHAQGKYPEAQKNFEASLLRFKARGDEYGQSKALNGLALVAESTGDYPNGYRLLEDCLDVCKRLGDRRGIVRSLHNLGYIAASSEQYQLAKQHYEECLYIRRDIGDRSGVGLTLLQLGEVYSALQWYTKSARLYHEAQQIYEDINDPMGMMLSQQHLGKAARLQKQYTQALTHLSGALAGSVDMGITAVALETLLEVATCLTEQGDVSTAWTLVNYILVHPASEQKLLKATHRAKASLPSHHPSGAAATQADTSSLETFVRWVLASPYFFRGS